MKAVTRFIDNNYLVFSLAITVVAGGVFIYWSERYEGKATVFETLKGNRSAVYGALASIFGSLLGFVITAVSVVVGFSTSDRLALVRNSKHYPTLWAAFTHTIKVLGLATLAALAALIFDRDNNQLCWMTYANFATSLLAVLLLARSIWALEQVVAIVAKPSEGLASVDGPQR